MTGQAGDPAFAAIASALSAWDLSFLLAAGRSIVLCADELLIFIRPLMSDELFSSDGDTLNPVGFAIPSHVRERMLPLTADNL